MHSNTLELVSIIGTEMPAQTVSGFKLANPYQPMFAQPLTACLVSEADEVLVDAPTMKPHGIATPMMASVAYIPIMVQLMSSSYFLDSKTPQYITKTVVTDCDPSQVREGKPGSHMAQFHAVRDGAKEDTK
jgi:hypothetical protein